MNFLAQTRSTNPTNKNFLSAILDPNADLNGLYTFSDIVPFTDLAWLENRSYAQICYHVFSQLGILDPKISHSTDFHIKDNTAVNVLDSHLLEFALSSYQTFRTQSIAPLIQIAPNFYSLELYHGPTFAFKDMALQPFSKLLDSLANAHNQKYLILSATSGDTGPATLYGFANCKNIRAICIYPQGGTSEVQRLQMTTNCAPNLKVFGIKGDFDTAQSALKSLLRKQSFRDSLKHRGYALSAANSVNIGRIAFQIVYYFVIARELLAQRKTHFSVIVPSGNFGNALAGFFAKKLGLPITKICIASNPNDILCEFFNTGVYDLRNKILKPSFSPAMDILKSSNIERLLFAFFGAEKTRQYMESLDNKQVFTLTKEELSRLQEVFEAQSFSDCMCLRGIKEAFDERYVLDPHTSNAYLFAKARNNPAMPCDVSNKQRTFSTRTSDEAQVIISTAHFSKFAKTTLRALKNKESARIDSLSDLQALQEIIKEIHLHIDSNFTLESDIADLFKKKEVHTKSYTIENLEQEILDFCV